MKHTNHIREQLEQMAKKHMTANAMRADNKSTVTKKKNHHRLHLNWKDVVIFFIHFGGWLDV